MFKKLLMIALILSVALTAGAGKVLATPQIDPGGIGDLNLFGLYDVRMVDGRTAGWQNFIVIENTSNQWTALHLRFRGWKKSIEVYDHVILLSPFDVFWCVLEQATEPGTTTDGQAYTAGEVKIWSLDYHTLYNSGLTYAAEADFAGWLTKFQADLLDDCGFIADLDNLTDYEKGEMQAGEVEIIGLWQLTNPYGPNNDDTHDLFDVVGNVYPDTAINMFDVMNALYYQYTDISTPQARNQGWAPDAVDNTAVVINDEEEGDDLSNRNAVDCGNVLASAMSMGDITNGRFQLANFVAISDFRTDQSPGVHRDTFGPGAIVYPVDTLFWNWDAVIDDGNTAYYVNENWATTVGVGLRDGDDLIGEAQATGGCGTWAVDDFNNTWSLDDLETALANDQIWYQYFNNPWGANYTTDVAIAFFTKHYHYFFADFPYYRKTTAPYDAAPNLIPLGLEQNYWKAVYDYRGDRGNAKIGAAHGEYRSVEEATGCNTTEQTIKEWFAATYANGKVYAYSYVWDMEQNKPETQEDYTPPPGSPWHPVPPESKKWIPHEVNIIRVGAGTPTVTGYITDANGFLTNPAPDNYEMGHFSLIGISLANGQRIGGHYGTTGSYLLPSIGVVIFDLNYTGALYRSCMAPWHFRLATVE